MERAAEKIIPPISNQQASASKSEFQRQLGDYLVEGHRSDLPRKIHVELIENDLFESRKIWNQWKGTNQQTQFEKEYRFIASLLEVEVDQDLIRSASHFLNPSYRCFVFNQVHMVPTTEEYASLFDGQ
ncbi:hypothetical protein CCACVL1_05498, partial [Corchorus capsularis]